MYDNLLHNLHHYGLIYHYFSFLFCPLLGPVAQSVQRLTTGWTVRGSNPGGARFSARPDWPWCRPSLLYNGYRVFHEGKVRPGHAADHSPPSSAVVMEEQSYTSTHPLGHNRACNGNTLPLPSCYSAPYLLSLTTLTCGNSALCTGFKVINNISLHFNIVNETKSF
jgi:hypothetical protein